MLLSAMAIKYRYLLLWDSSEITALYLYMLQWIKRYCPLKGANVKCSQTFLDFHTSPGEQDIHSRW